MPPPEHLLIHCATQCTKNRFTFIDWIDLIFLAGTHASSECSCGEGECSHHAIEEGPNQVNFLASTNEIAEANVTSPDEVEAVIPEKNESEDQDQYDVLKRVIVNLELMTDRKKSLADTRIDRVSWMTLVFAYQNDREML